MKKIFFIIIINLFCIFNVNAITAEQEREMNLGGCSGYTFDTSCRYNNFYSCIWNETEYGDYCNTDKLVYVYCGEAFDIPIQAPEIISFFVNLLKIATPIILIIVSMISLVKALAASKEDEIKKAQKSIITKIIASVIIFFTVSIVQFVIMKVADSSEVGGLTNCLSCFLNNDCESSAYYKTSVFGKYECTYLDGMQKFDCIDGEIINSLPTPIVPESVPDPEPEKENNRNHGGSGGKF